MKTFVIYSKEKGSKAEYFFLEEGFSKKAMILNLAWLLYNRLWLPALMLVFMVNLILELGQVDIIRPLGVLLSLLMLACAVGFVAKDLLQKRLTNDNYALVDVIVSDSLDQAEYKFISKLNKNYRTVEHNVKLGGNEGSVIS